MYKDSNFQNFISQEDKLISRSDLPNEVRVSNASELETVFNNWRGTIGDQLPKLKVATVVTMRSVKSKTSSYDGMNSKVESSSGSGILSMKRFRFHRSAVEEPIKRQDSKASKESMSDREGSVKSFRSTGSRTEIRRLNDQAN